MLELLQTTIRYIKRKKMIKIRTKNEFNFQSLIHQMHN